MTLNPLRLFSNSADCDPDKGCDPEIMAKGMGGPGDCDYMASLFGDGHQGAENIAAVFACINVIAGSIASLPLRLMKEVDGSLSPDTKHYIHGFLNDTPNDLYGWKQLREATLWRTLTKGNAYCPVIRRSSKVREMFLARGDASIEISNRRLLYTVHDTELEYEALRLRVPDIAHFRGMTRDGIRGISPIEHCRTSTASAQGLQRMGAKNIGSGGALRGIISKLSFAGTKDVKDERRKQLYEAVSKAKNSAGILMLEHDAEWKSTSMTLQDAQFIQQMEFSVVEIARIYGVPPHKIQHLAQATFNNIEVLNFEFYRATLLPWICRKEEVYDNTLLTSDERAQGYRIKHDVDGLLRADTASRGEYNQRAVTHWATVNEVRAKEGLPPVEGGDVLQFPINHMPLTNENRGNPRADQQPQE